MSDVLDFWKGVFGAALLRIVPEIPEAIENRIEVTMSQNGHGDISTNIALVASKLTNMKPRDLAQSIIDNFSMKEETISMEIGGNGFINVTLNPTCWNHELDEMFESIEKYSRPNIGKKQKVNVEFVSANPTGPLHIGHCRGAVIGDVLANVLKYAGYKVTKEFYCNDAGGQIEALAWSTYFQYLTLLGENPNPDDFELQYKGDYLIPVAQKLVNKYGDEFVGDEPVQLSDELQSSDGPGIAHPDLWMDKVKEIVIEAMEKMIFNDLSALGVQFDVVTSEKEIIARNLPNVAIGRLDNLGLIYDGVLESSHNEVTDEPNRVQTLFRSTHFGDDQDRALKKSDGSNTYFANDIGYHLDKASRGYTKIVNILGADHVGYTIRVKSATKAMYPDIDMDTVLYQLVRVVENGVPVKMSKRAGTFVEMIDLIDMVGADAVRFTMLTRKSTAQMDFDVKNAVATTKENPLYYVQYAHARCCSVLRKTGLPTFNSHLPNLTHPTEIALIRRLALWPVCLKLAAQNMEPHRIAFYLIDLATDFHALWNQGQKDTTLRFIQEDPYVTNDKIMLVSVVGNILKIGLDLMGIKAVDVMEKDEPT